MYEFRPGILLHLTRQVSNPKFSVAKSSAHQPFHFYGLRHDVLRDLVAGGLSGNGVLHIPSSTPNGIPPETCVLMCDEKRTDGTDLEMEPASTYPWVTGDVPCLDRSDPQPEERAHPRGNAVPYKHGRKPKPAMGSKMTSLHVRIVGRATSDDKLPQIPWRLFCPSMFTTGSSLPSLLSLKRSAFRP